MTIPVREIAGRAEGFLPEMTEFLRAVVDINTHSTNGRGINLVGSMFDMSIPSAFRRDVITGPDGVEHRLFTLGGGEGRTVLIGHMDTVFAPDSTFQRMTVEGETIRGPGTADMKGGLVVMVYALKILEGLGMLGALPICCLLNGDEEVGSPFSRRIVKDLARGASRALVFECGGLAGEVVTARRGVARYRIRVTGKARHAGVKSGPKASALAEIARMVLELEALNSDKEGLSVNVGKIEGGNVTNIVPDDAMALFEARFWDDDAGSFLAERIWEVTSRVATAGCSARLEAFGHSRPAMVPASGTYDMLAAVQSAAASLGQVIGAQRRGGASDGNFLAAAGIPTLDGLGPAGDHDHSTDEYIVMRSLADRAALTAALLAGLGS